MEVKIVDGTLVVKDDNGNDVTEEMLKVYTHKDLLTLFSMVETSATLKFGQVSYGDPLDPAALAGLTLTRNGRPAVIDVDQEMVEQLFKICAAVSGNPLWCIADYKDTAYLTNQGIQFDAATAEYQDENGTIVPSSLYGCCSIMLPCDCIKSILDMAEIAMDDKLIMLKIGDAVVYRGRPEESSLISDQSEEKILLIGME